MKILHTSDWHIGRALYGRKRYAEFEAFLDWLAGTIEEEKIDLLLVAGDVFDNSTPSNLAQKLYYRFLCRVASSADCHVVIIAGNHDSPSFINAPRDLLASLNVHVVGVASETPEDEVVVVPGPDKEPGMIVCAIPYLRDREIRKAEAGESVEDKEQKIVDGIRSHYQRVCEAAEAMRKQMEKPVPIIAMGHLFAAGGQTVDGDGVRHLYIGSLAQVRADVFPEAIDYLALGHLHIPQKVGDSEWVRYSGSPLPIGFGEAAQAKSVVLVDFANLPPTVTTRPIPIFQELKIVKGDWQVISRHLAEMKAEGSHAWVEVAYDGEDVVGNLREQLDGAIADTDIEILRIANNRLLERSLGAGAGGESLDDIDPAEVFDRCLQAYDVPVAQYNVLQNAYQEIIVSLDEVDPRAQ